MDVGGLVVVTLFYQLIFNLIGYTGQHTDYGTRGYPLKVYPLGPPADAASASGSIV